MSNITLRKISTLDRALTESTKVLIKNICFKRCESNRFLIGVRVEYTPNKSKDIFEAAFFIDRNYISFELEHGENAFTNPTYLLSSLDASRIIYYILKVALNIAEYDGSNFVMKDKSKLSIGFGELTFVEEIINHALAELSMDVNVERFVLAANAA